MQGKHYYVRLVPQVKCEIYGYEPTPLSHAGTFFSSRDDLAKSFSLAKTRVFVRKGKLLGLVRLREAGL